jgi:hypothetical protein
MREALRGALYNPWKEDYDATTRILLGYYTVCKAQRSYRGPECIMWSCEMFTDRSDVCVKVARLPGSAMTYMC